MEKVKEGQALREAQVLVTTEEVREAGYEGNPIVFAEQGPNRFRVMSWFFPEEDGVNITEDIDTETYTVNYFNDQGEIELEPSSPLYQWAVDLYEND